MKRSCTAAVAPPPALLSALLALSACQAMAPTPPPEESYVRAEDGTLLYFVRMGAGDEVLVVPDASWVAEDMERLARGRTVIFYDPRGRGRSDPKMTFRMEQDVRDLETIVEWFRLERFSLLGTQLGATLVAQYTDRHPEAVERLVLVSPPPIRKDPYWDIYERVFNDRKSEAAFQDLRKLRAELVNVHDPARWAESYKEALFTGWVANEASIRNMKSEPFIQPNDDPESQIKKYLGMLRDLGAWDWREDLGSITCPTLVVYGEDDPVPRRSFEEWTESIPSARSFVIPGTGRLPWIESPRRFYAEVEAFLAE